MRSAAVTLLTLLACVQPGHAQGVRGTAVTTVRTVELRPLLADTIDPQLAGDSLPCPPGPRCVILRAGPRRQAVALTQDVRLTAWGLGVSGLSAVAFLRARADAGGTLAWPRSDDAFDALLAYVEYDHEPFRIRAGRQTTLGGLGFSSYDGVEVLFRRAHHFGARAYAGRSLARGLVEPRAEALRGFEDFVPDASVLLFGGALDAQPAHGLRVSARYQREVFSNRSALVSERASLETVVDAFAPLRVDASADWDFAFARLGKADVRLVLPLAGDVRVEAAARRYVPYFELWTIWGFFDPVAWHETEARVSWTPGTTQLSATLGAALRRYDETDTAILGPDLERDTRRLTFDVAWQPARTWLLDFRWQHETGFGASMGGADLGARWNVRTDVAVSAFVTALQQIDEFRVGEGTVFGGGVAGEIPLGERLSLEGGASLYRQGSTRADSPDWTQRRAWLSFRAELGTDPGRTARRQP